MSTITQGEAVFQAVREVFPDGAVPNTTEWTAAQKEKVNAIVFHFFKTGVTVHKSNPDDAALLKYIPGLVNNWVRKDKRLNGGTTYQAKNPGSRMGAGDEQLKNLKLLLAAVTDEETKSKVQAAIAQRQEELKPKANINIEALPPHLRAFVKQ